MIIQAIILAILFINKEQIYISVQGRSFERYAHQVLKWALIRREGRSQGVNNSCQWLMRFHKGFPGILNSSNRRFNKGILYFKRVICPSRALIQEIRISLSDKLSAFKFSLSVPRSDLFAENNSFFHFFLALIKTFRLAEYFFSSLKYRF